MQQRVVRVLEYDPELGELLEGARQEQARLEAIAQVRVLEAGDWEGQEWPSDIRRGFGLLMLDGLLVRTVNLAGRHGAELLSRGDLLRPWQEDDASASVLRSTGWRVLERVQVAELDVDFALRVRAYPEITSQLMARTLRRVRDLAVIIAIVHQPRVDRRVLMLLWHLADRWGRVRSDGVLVPMRLTHTIVADLVAARRPTVTGALAALEREGQISRSGDGWLLHGPPPGEIAGAPSSRLPAISQA